MKDFGEKWSLKEAKLSRILVVSSSGAPQFFSAELHGHSSPTSVFLLVVREVIKSQPKLERETD